MSIQHASHYNEALLIAVWNLWLVQGPLTANRFSTAALFNHAELNLKQIVVLRTEYLEHPFQQRQVTEPPLTTGWSEKVARFVTVCEGPDHDDGAMFVLYEHESFWATRNHLIDLAVLFSPAMRSCVNNPGNIQDEVLQAEMDEYLDNLC